MEEDKTLLECMSSEFEETKRRVRRQLASDAVRILGGALLMAILFLPELIENLLVVKYVAGFLLAVAIMTHVTRRILFPYVNLKAYAQKALENPIAASIVFFSMSIIIAVTIDSSADFFSR